MPEKTNKDRALGAVSRAGKKAKEADRALLAMMRLAQAEGASYREIGAAADLPHTTVAYRLKGAADEPADAAEA